MNGSLIPAARAAPRAGTEEGPATALQINAASDAASKNAGRNNEAAAGVKS